MKTIKFSPIIRLSVFLFLALSVGVSAQAAEFPIAKTSGHQEISLSAAYDGVNYLVAILDSVNCPGTLCSSEVSAQLVSATDGSLIGSRIITGLEGDVPSVAFDGTNFLMVWKGEDSANPPNPYIYGQLVNTLGVLIGSAFQISPVVKIGGASDAIKVVYDGANYFVVWEDRADPASQDTGKIYGRFVTPSGILLGDIIPVSDPVALHGQVYPAVAFDGTNIFVIWVDGRNQRACDNNVCYPSDIYGQLIAKSATGVAGAVTGSNLFIYWSEYRQDSPLSVASSGANYFVLMQRNSGFPGSCPWIGCVWGIYGFYAGLDGYFLGQFTTIFSNYYNNSFPSIVWNPTKSQYLANWTERYSSSKMTIETSTVDVDPDKGSFGGPAFVLPTANGKLPLAAIPLVAGDNYLILINRGKPGKEIGDSDAFKGPHVYGTFIADLVTTSVSDPPSIARALKGFSVYDTVENQGIGISRPTETYYIFSPTGDPADINNGWLTGKRSIPAIPAKGTSTGNATITIPSWIPAGDYYLLACVNSYIVAETDFSNNCKVSAGKAHLIKPDLVATSVTNDDLTATPKNVAKPPHSIKVTDEVTNQGEAVSSPTSTSYYLSATPSKDASAVKLGGSRSLPALPPNNGKISKGTVKAKVPLNKGLDKFADYYLLACPNDYYKKPANGPMNCAPSSTQISCSACH